MSSHVVAVQDLIILAGQTDSNELFANRDFQDSDGITVFAPTVMPETVTVYVAGRDNPQASDYRALQRNEKDFTIEAGKAETIALLPYKAMKLVASSAVAADRTFQVNKLFWV